MNFIDRKENLISAIYPRHPEQEGQGTNTFKKSMIVLSLCFVVLLTASPQSPAQKLPDSVKTVMPSQFRGFIDHSGNRILAVPYDWFSGFHEGLAAVRDKDKSYGYIDRSGKEIIKPQFDDARDFSDGLAAVKRDDSWGFIDHTGKFVIAPTFQAAGEFSEGVARVYIRWFDHDRGLATSSSALIDRKGNQVVQVKSYDSIESLHEGLAVVRKGSACFYADTNGEAVIRPKYYGLGRFVQGLANVRLSGQKAGFIDRTGRLIVQIEGQETTPFCEGICIVHHPKTKSLRIVDMKGKALYSLRNLDFASRFSEGCAVVGVKGWDWPVLDTRKKRLFVDRKGKKVFKDVFHTALPFSEGLAAVNFSVFEPYSREESYEPDDFLPDARYAGMEPTRPIKHLDEGATPVSPSEKSNQITE